MTRREAKMQTVLLEFHRALAAVRRKAQTDAIKAVNVSNFDRMQAMARIERVDFMLKEINRALE